MADNVTLDAGSGGATIRTLEDGSSIQWPVGVCVYATTVGTPDVLQVVTTTAGLPVQAQTGASFPVTDNSGSLTVDAPVGTPVFVRLSDGSSAITTLPVSLASVPSHAVTNAGTFAVQVDGAALTALQLLDDVIYVDDADFTDDTSKFALIGGVYQSSPQTITDGDVGPILLDANGKVQVATHAVTQSGTWNVGTVTTLTSITNAVTVSQGTAANLNCTEASAATIATNTGNAATSLAILDDWDESDRARVNLIVGQAGIAAGAGAVGVTVPRVTLASDDPGVALLTTIDADTGGILTAVQLLDNVVRSEDEASAGGHSGAVVLARRTDTPANQSGTDGDYEFLQMSAGRLWVDPSGVTLTVASHAVTNAGTFATQATLQTGDNTVGRLKLTDGTDVADVLDLTNSNPLTVAIVDGDGTQITSFGGGTQYTEGDTDASITGTAVMWEDGSNTLRAASAAKPLPVEIIAGGGTGGTSAADDADFTAGTTAGTPAMGVYESTPSSVTDGDLGTVGITQTRALRVNVDNTVTVGSHAVTNAGTFVVQVNGDALTALQLIDDTVYVDDADWTDNTSKHLLVGGVYQATPHTVTDGDVTPFLTDANGRLAVSVGNTVTVASHAVTNAGTFAVQVDGAALTALQLIDDAIFAEDVAAQAADKGIAVLAVRRDADTSLVGTDNDYANLQVDANGYLKVEIFDGGGSHTVDNAGTFAVQVDGNALTALQLIDDPVFADDAAFTVGTSKVMVAGGIVDDDSTDAADEGDAVAFRATKERKQRVVAAMDSAAMQSGNDEVVPKFAVISASSSGDNTLVSAVASKKLRVLSYTIIANGTVTVRFESGASGTALTGQMDFVVNTGVSVAFSPVGHFETAANTLLNLELSGAVEVAGHLAYIEVD